LQNAVALGAEASRGALPGRDATNRPRYSEKPPDLPRTSTHSILAEKYCLQVPQNSDSLVKLHHNNHLTEIQGGFRMGQPYIGECRIVGFTFAPNGWAMCQGQLMAISENDTLFNLIGTTYGGDGQSTFGVPDLQGRTPIHQGTSQGVTFTLGEKAGVESVTVSTQQMPIHNHALLATSVNGNSNFPQNNVLAANPTFIYVTSGPNANKAMNNAAITTAGGSQPHDNRQPYLTMSWVISLFGIFPSQG
jgi:microcystin-dependent protein